MAIKEGANTAVVYFQNLADGTGPIFQLFVNGEEMTEVPNTAAAMATAYGDSSYAMPV